ncbi:MFS transporter [[Clostridium] symbiosum]|uniref:MFS transporter n=1 Tax=Clostridium symbiosum TaxID=1512 RepID=UPI00189F1A44|nr:MFS transporter [[Clostridium] symbiosum]MDB2038425.1 MFS transporter [[Clostridium] symbiosum]
MKAQPYRFTICALSTVMVFVCVGLVSNAFSICLPFIIKVHGFSNTQISLLATMKSVTSLLAMFAADRYYGRLGLKKGIALAMLSASLSFFIYGISSTPLLYCAASALSGISYAMGGMIPASLLIRQWFPLKPAAALGIAASGSGIGSVLGPVTLLFLIENFGLSSAFLAQALAVAAVTLPIVALIRENTPEHTGIETAGVEDFPETEVSSGSSRDCIHGGTLLHNRLSRREQLRILCGSFLIGVLGLTGFNYLSLLYTSAGHSAATVSFFLSLMGILLIAGKCSFGWIADRAGSFRTAALFCLFLCIGQLLCCFAPQSGRLLFGITFLFLGMGLALASVGLSIMASDFCQVGNYATVLKNYQLSYALGGLVSSAVPGMLADRTGSYLPSYILFFILSIALFLFIIPVYRRHGGTLPHKSMKAAAKHPVIAQTMHRD